MVPERGHGVSGSLRQGSKELVTSWAVTDITDLFWTFPLWTPVSLDWLCSLQVA
jgi:hypothetical protein